MNNPLTYLPISSVFKSFRRPLDTTPSPPTSPFGGKLETSTTSSQALLFHPETQIWKETKLFVLDRVLKSLFPEKTN